MLTEVAGQLDDVDPAVVSGDFAQQLERIVP
jgi:hypothetical protein